MRAKAFFSFDEYDNDLTMFCERLLAVLSGTWPNNKFLYELIDSGSCKISPDETVIKALSSLSDKKQAVLVIDDLHLIHNDLVVQFLLAFIKRLPKNFQVVLISRHDLSHGFSELWLKGQLVRIDARSFIFSSEEIKSLFNKRGMQITQERADEIKEQTFGWAIGINALLLSDNNPSIDVYDYLNDYMEKHIWNTWDDITRNFLIKTATLRELTPSSGRAMTGVWRPDNFLKELAQKGVFITESEEGVYHYNHLFQRFLMSRAQEKGEGFLTSLLDAEGVWHLSQKDFYNAAVCFTQSKNYLQISTCFELMEASGFENFSISKFLPIIKHPAFEEAANEHSQLLYFLAYISLVEGRLDDTVLFIDKYYERHSTVSRDAPKLDSNLIHMLFLDFRIPMVRIPHELESRGVNSKAIPPKWNLSMHMPILHRGSVDYSIDSDYDITDFIENLIAKKTKWSRGDRLPLFAEVIIAGLLYERGELEKAHERALRANAKIKANTLIDTGLCAMYILVCILDAIGDTSEASMVVQSISKMIEENNEDHLKLNFDAFSARRKFIKGDIEAANSWIDKHYDKDLGFYEMYEAFTTCRALMIVKKYSLAIILLSKMLEVLEAFNRTQDIIYARILLAVSCWKKKRGFQNDALVHLEEAVLTAYPYEHVQMFVNEGAELYAILYKLQKSVEQRKSDDKKHLGFIKMLCQKTSNVQSEIIIEKSIEKRPKFTDKQMMIMELLCEFKTQKEIADIMDIKLSTLRSHRNSIYNKLEVATVSDAVKKINELKLLEN